jgi:hypothetical protein
MQFSSTSSIKVSKSSSWSVKWVVGSLSFGFEALLAGLVLSLKLLLEEQ